MFRRKKREHAAIATLVGGGTTISGNVAYRGRLHLDGVVEGDVTGEIEVVVIEVVVIAAVGSASASCTASATRRARAGRESITCRVDQRCWLPASAYRPWGRRWPTVLRPTPWILTTGIAGSKGIRVPACCHR